MQFGRLVHHGRLEPATVLDRYAVMPDMTNGIKKADGAIATNPKATREYASRVQEWTDQHAGREIVTQDEFDRLKGVLDALWSNPRARGWLSGDGISEVSIVWHDKYWNILCKARIDRVVHVGEGVDLLVDLKTTDDASRFERSIVDRGYDRQAAFYTRGWEQLTGAATDFGFCVVESSAPYGIRAAVAGPDVMERGGIQVTKALANVLTAEREKLKPLGYPQQNEFNLPRWARRDPVVMVGGEPVEVRS
jgi:hypothetical protein